MLVGQTDQPNWLNILEGTHVYPGGNIEKKIEFVIFKYLLCF